MKQVYLLTGKAGTGKTSLIKQVVPEILGKAGGFYTEEIRSQGIRKGFRLVTLDGQSAILAHVKSQSRYRVGKYGVDIDSLDQVGVPALLKATEQCDLVVIDEIGKMELCSYSFRKAVLGIIGSGKKLLGTIMFSPNPWADAIKRRPQVELVPVTGSNSHQVLEGVKRWLKA
ncbi:MAG: AAA family ATPase [Dehalococcoidales bacterium]|jgi:nucleoside-triphosphatase|nr:AAA family ATPase [Dehalococcoidales bacterium]|tara:strand:+ start:2391 stop:2906 length:516 start_codon:yes stop_codon:yes gene_type:complete